MLSKRPKSRKWLEALRILEAIEPLQPQPRKMSIVFEADRTFIVDSSGTLHTFVHPVSESPPENQNGM